MSSSSMHRESEASNIEEIREFWHICTLLAASQRRGGPNNPQALEYLDDLSIIAQNTDQTVLRKRCRQVIHEHNTGLAASRLLVVI